MGTRRIWVALATAVVLAGAVPAGSSAVAPLSGAPLTEAPLTEAPLTKAGPSLGTDRSDWILTSTKLPGSPSQIAGAPPGVGLITGYTVGVGMTTSIRTPDGAVRLLGTYLTPLLWLGGDSPGVPPLLVAKRDENGLGDFNGDGDRLDEVIFTSRGYAAPVAQFAAKTDVGEYTCHVRLSAAVAVVCQSERASGRDFDGDGFLRGSQAMIVHGDGRIVMGPPGYGGRALPDGSVVVGAHRILADGSVVPLPPSAMGVQAIVGSTVVGYNFSTGTNQIVSAAGTVVNFDRFSGIYQIGRAVWIQVRDQPLCRLHEDTTMSCLGIRSAAVPAGVSGLIEPIGDDAAIIPAAVTQVGAEPHAYLVPAGGAPIALGIAVADVVVDLGNGSGLVGATGAYTATRTSQLFHVTSAGAVTNVSVHGAYLRSVMSLDDGRAMVTLAESSDGAGTSGVDLNGDGDRWDAMRYLYADGALVALGIETTTATDSVWAVALEPGGAIFTRIDESLIRNLGAGVDLNGDGDRADSVATVIDGGQVVNLGIAIGTADYPRGSPPVRIGQNQGMFGWFPSVGPGIDLSALNQGVVYTITDLANAPAYVATPPRRLLDTRVDGPQIGYSGLRPTDGQTVEVTTPDGAGSVVINVTGLNATEGGFVTIHPCGEPRPVVSNLNLTPGLITPNLVISKVGATGKVCVFTQRSADLIVDLAGSSATGSAYTALSPIRVLDTRLESAIGYTGPKPTSGQTIEVTAPSGAGAVVLNITGLDSTSDGFVTVYPCGEPMPTASSLNLGPGVITANMAISKVGATGKVCLYTQRSAHLIADLAGTFARRAPYVALTPVRVLDTRPEAMIGYQGPKPAGGQTIEVGAPAGATAVVLNITGLDATEAGFVTVYPCGAAMPTASNLNLTPGRITPNLTITQVGTSGQAADRVCIYTQRSANLIADLVGTFP